MEGPATENALLTENIRPCLWYDVVSARNAVGYLQLYMSCFHMQPLFFVVWPYEMLNCFGLGS